MVPRRRRRVSAAAKMERKQRRKLRGVRRSIVLCARLNIGCCPRAGGGAAPALVPAAKTTEAMKPNAIAAAKVQGSRTMAFLLWASQCLKLASIPAFIPRAVPVYAFADRMLQRSQHLPTIAQHRGSHDSVSGPAADASTTLADLFTPLLFADLSSAVGTSLRSWSNDEFDDGVAHGREARLRWWAVDSFFPAPLVRGDGVGGMRKRSWS
jgi:hypothetical protein